MKKISLLWSAGPQTTSGLLCISADILIIAAWDRHMYILYLLLIVQNLGTAENNMMYKISLVTHGLVFWGPSFGSFLTSFSNFWFFVVLFMYYGILETPTYTVIHYSSWCCSYHNRNTGGPKINYQHIFGGWVFDQEHRQSLGYCKQYPLRYSTTVFDSLWYLSDGSVHTVVFQLNYGRNF